MVVLPVLGGSCTTRQTGSCRSGAAPVEPARIVRVERATARPAKDNPLRIWREAVAKQTLAAVAAGNTDLEQVRRIVCEQTAEQEQAARQRYLALADAIHHLSVQAAEEFTERNPDLRRTMQSELKQAVRDANERTFTARRESLIRTHFEEAMEAQ